MSEDKPVFDSKLAEGVAYFERMLKVMPDDRTTLEFLAVAYPQLDEPAKAEYALSELARVLLKEGDYEHAAALLPRLEACESSVAQAMAIRVRAHSAPKPELVPEEAKEDAAAGIFAAACEREALLAEKLGDADVAAHLRGLPDNGRVYLVSALSVLEKEKPEAFEKALVALADEYGEIPIPLEAFEPDKKKSAALGEELVKIRGVIPFATLGALTLVAYVSPHDAELKQTVAAKLGVKPRFYLAEPRLVEAAIAKLWPEAK